MIPIQKYSLAAAIAALLMVFPVYQSLLSKPQERILVLGFDTKQLNDVQDRLLRETVMRQFHVSGFRIVPVMEIEALFHGDQKRQIRKLKQDEMKSLCDDLQAGYACCGSIMPETGIVDEQIKTGSTYICSVTLFSKEKNKFEEIRLKVAGEDNLFLFNTAVSKMIVAEIEKLL